MNNNQGSEGFREEVEALVMGARACLSLHERHLLALHARAEKPVVHSSREDSTGGPGFPADPMSQMHRFTELLLGYRLSKLIFNLGGQIRFRQI